MLVTGELTFYMTGGVQESLSAATTADRAAPEKFLVFLWPSAFEILKIFLWPNALVLWSWPLGRKKDLLHLAALKIESVKAPPRGSLSPTVHDFAGCSTSSLLLFLLSVFSRFPSSHEG